MTMDGNTDFAKVRYITHKLRMCGHRFCVTQIVAHPLLPLVLTVSQSRCSRVDDIARKSLSEVILWRTCSVGPLCKSGGMTELARIVSPIHFGCVRTAWIPAHLPRCCFIVSDGQNLVIYQTNVRAHDLVEMDDSTKQLGSPIESMADMNQVHIKMADLMPLLIPREDCFVVDERSLLNLIESSKHNQASLPQPPPLPQPQHPGNRK
ncbi:unnamed protein product, partial [Cylicocyclus nassatus]